MGEGISKMAKQELLATIRDPYRASLKREKSRILDEFIAVTGHHRKHGIRLLGQSGDDGEEQPAAKKGRRTATWIYDESVRQALPAPPPWTGCSSPSGHRRPAGSWSGKPLTGSAANGRRRHYPIWWSPSSATATRRHHGVDSQAAKAYSACGTSTAAVSQRRHPGPAAPAHQDTGEPPAPTQEAAVAGPQYSGTNCTGPARRLECAATRIPGD